MIYTNKNMRKKYLELLKNNPDAITIYFAGEAISCDFNIFDYGVVFDRGIEFKDRVFRHPTYHFLSESIYQEYNDMSYEQAKEEYRHREFCNFIYSNANAHYKRDELFYVLSEYKRVDALGKHLNNTGRSSTRQQEDWRKISIKEKSNYRFSISAENAVFDGYTSEKILTSLQAHSIPVYFGDPSIYEEFNPDCFINANMCSSADELLEIIRKVDSNEELWCKMVTEKWRTDEQVIKQKKEYDDYCRFIDHIFEQDIENARRIGQGTYPAVYNDYFMQAKSVKRWTKKKIVRKVREILSS